MRLGIDFDNTIASYEEMMHRWAVERGLIPVSIPRNKRCIRDAIRAQEDGESKWRALQVFCYGLGMPHARAMPGVTEFLAACKGRSIPVWIVSHKTEDANFGDPGVKLREGALRWLEKQGFLDSPEFGIGHGRVHFEETRQEKIARIRSLGLTHFIDDLEETFREPSFPPSVARILLGGRPAGHDEPPWRARASWPEIQRELLGS